MIFQYRKTKKIVEILNDLIMIQEDRISGYHLALESASQEPHFNDAIKSCISGGLQYKQRLAHKMKQIDGAIVCNTLLPGRLYKAWGDLRMKFRKGTRKATIASCQYNEVIALHVSNAATCGMTLAPEIRELIAEQEKVLRYNMSVMKSCNEAHALISSGLVYFN